MALYIYRHPLYSGVVTWHIGMSVPTITGKSIFFKACGDELRLILSAMKAKLIVPDAPGFLTPDEILQMLIKELRLEESAVTGFEQVKTAIQSYMAKQDSIESEIKYLRERVQELENSTSST